uniref:Uncharacterized protein n=1 Tax=Arundo donax TaxID=35708 RepID=A0A0A9C5B5_ARUDO
MAPSKVSMISWSSSTEIRGFFPSLPSSALSLRAPRA